MGEQLIISPAPSVLDLRPAMTRDAESRSVDATEMRTSLFQLIWKDRPSSVFFMSPAPAWSGVSPEGADVGPDEAASTTNQWVGGDSARRLPPALAARACCQPW